MIFFTLFISFFVIFLIEGIKYTSELNFNRAHKGKYNSHKIGLDKNINQKYMKIKEILNPSVQK